MKMGPLLSLLDDYNKRLNSTGAITGTTPTQQLSHTNHHSCNYTCTPTINDNNTSGINSRFHQQLAGKHRGIGRSIAEFERGMTFAPSSSGMVIGSDAIEQVIGGGLRLVHSSREFMSSSKI